MGDFNAHHREWGCEHSDGQGIALLNSALEASFSCINDGSPTFVTCPNQARFAMNLAFISSSIVGLCDWMALEDTYFSDHHPIVTHFNFYIKKKKYFSHKIKHSKTSDGIFVKNLNQNLATFKEFVNESSLSPLEKYSIFANHLMEQLPEKAGSRSPKNSNISHMVDPRCLPPGGVTSARRLLYSDERFYLILKKFLLLLTILHLRGRKLWQGVS